MRTFLAILIGCVVMLGAFSLPWSFFGVSQHSYGGEDRFSQILGTVVYFGIYLLPFSLFFALLLVWPAERFGRRLARFAHLTLRGLAWLLAACVYIGSTIAARHDLALVATACGVFAAIAATFVYSLVVRPHEITSHTTAV
jgi:hypothetical protein